MIVQVGQAGGRFVVESGAVVAAVEENVENKGEMRASRSWGFRAMVRIGGGDDRGQRCYENERLARKEQQAGRRAT
ncbi:uncharacterized protein SPSK_00640 [Sporothrix schenckii 1099-18]|uniref:Uncharacterized protein n=1 Tax=Sporothrix schenckii 1099-18 TaxID=1397361 RepID=A0A0F2LU05_SPOSC|nr:uncharacterized protein SPSK_00640 [Sporothrix schenckii 1099-18]KJR79990.1 hypothetical protein SPSK_00640 [Sporothrix schenckii 1099-18]